MTIKKILFFFLVLFINTCIQVSTLSGQAIAVSTQIRTLYDFIDELASLQLIEVNSAVKPYSRKQVSKWLFQAQTSKEALNKRQQQLLEYYLRDYYKEAFLIDTSIETDMYASQRKILDFKSTKKFDAFYEKNEDFQITVNPVLGVHYDLSNNAFRRWYGGEVESYIGSKWSVYFNFRDFSENNILSSPSYLNQLRSGVSLPNNPKGVLDFSEVKGGLSYGFKHGSFSLIQEDFIWGNNTNGALIFTDRAPAVTQLKLNYQPTRWLEFNYIHAWLNSSVVDSLATYTIPNSNNATRLVYHKKFVAANMFTLSPFSNLNISFGNSVVYSGSSIHPAYLIPVFFYRSVDHALSTRSNLAGQNGQMFLDISSRNIKNIHLYANLFIDELRLSVLWDKEKQRNQLSYKIGASVFNLLNSNISFKTEYTRSNPFTYRHFIETTDFTSNQYLLGHYLGDNAQEFYSEIKYHPTFRLSATLFYLNSSKGAVLPFTNGNSNSGGTPFQETVEFTNQEIGIRINYQILQDGNVEFVLMQKNVTDLTESYTVDFERGKNIFYTLNLQWNF